MTTEVTWSLRPPLSRDDIPELCDQLAMLIAFTGATVVSCDVGGFGQPDMVLVDALARFQLTARRLGCRLDLARASLSLRLLLALVGLGHLGWEPEEREEPVGVEEVVERGDPAI